VLELEPTVEQRRQAMQGLVRLLEDLPDTKTERQRLLEELLADEGLSDDYLWWALRQGLQLALDEGDAVRARLLLARHGERLSTSDLKGYRDYLWAWVMVHEGRSEEAEPLVRWIDDWLEQRPITAQDLDAFGDLKALNRWLLGRIHLAEHRPQTALATFEEALALSPDADLLVAASAGRGEALAELERHAAAIDAFKEAVARLAALPAGQRRGVPRLKDTLLSLFDRLSAQARREQALAYLALAVELTPVSNPGERLELLQRLGEQSWVVAEAAADSQQQRAYYGQTGRCLEEAARLCEADESRHAGLLWSAAQGYDRAGQLGDVRRVLERFLAGRSQDPRLPRAFLQLGQAYEADGRFEEALKWYGRLHEEFPKQVETPQARLLRAGCLLALGREDEAQVALQELLEDGNLTPQSQVFQEALLELCDLLYHSGRYAAAISRLEDFAALCPEHPERYRSRFMLADAYRRSGLALRRDPPPHASTAAAEAAARERLERAAELFGELARDLAREPQRDQTLALYDRLSLFYQADCLFELNEPQTLREALELYARAAARYEREPAALTAQVQIAIIHLRRGELAEAARAIERARWLLRNIPDAAFVDDSGGAGRQQWDHYLAALSSSTLFRNVLVGNP